MPTLTQLKKSAKETGLVEGMEMLGFSLGPDYLWFYRWRGDYLDIIDFWLKSSKEWVEVPVMCFVEELVEHCDMSGFPKGFIRDVSSLSSLYIDEDGLELVGAPMEVANEEQVKQVLSHVLKTVQNEVDPWFKEITTKDKLFESLSPRLREGEMGEKYKKLLNL